MPNGILDSLAQTFLGETDSALNQPVSSPWQQELLETVNPQKVRAQNIKRAIAQASVRLATTPGDFLTGISAAAGEGANSYLQQQDQAQQDRMKAMQLVELAQQKQQDRRLQLLHDALGVRRDLTQDQQREEDRGYVNAERKARAEYYNKGGKSGAGASSGSASAIERRRGQAADTYFRQLDKMREQNYGEEPDEDQKDQLWSDIQRRFRLEDDGGDAPSGEQVPTSENKTDQQVVKTDTASTTKSGILPAPTPPPLDQRIVGQVYEVPGKGKFTWTGSGWKPVI